MSAKVNETTVCIVGVGACTALGSDAASSAAAVRAAVSGFNDHPYMIDKEGQPMVTARASHLPEAQTPAERLANLAIPAAQEALSPLAAAGKRIQGMPLVMALPPVRPGRPDNIETDVTVRCKAALEDGMSFGVVRTVPCGHSAGLVALGQAWRLIRAGDLEVCLVGGVDSYNEPETLEWLDETEQLHSDANKWGFIPGEGAGFVLLASPAFSAEHKLKVLGDVTAVAIAQEKNLIKTDSVCVGEGLSSAVRQVLYALSPPSELIHQTICDLNGERYRADEFGYTLTRTTGRLVEPGEFLAPADCWGDVGAASGPLYLGLAVAAGQKGYADGPNTLIWTSSESGERGAAIVRVEAAAREV